MISAATRGGDALGEITISGTSVDCTIYYGDEDPQLDTGAGIYTGGKIPGEVARFWWLATRQPISAILSMPRTVQ